MLVVDDDEIIDVPRVDDPVDNTREEAHMNNNALFIGWNRPTTGRERQSLEQFQDFSNWLTKQQSQKVISGFHQVLLNSHGGDLNGFFFIMGDTQNLMKLTSDETFRDHAARASVNMQNFGIIPAYTGQEMTQWFQRYAKFL